MTLTLHVCIYIYVYTYVSYVYPIHVLLPSKVISVLILSPPNSKPLEPQAATVQKKRVLQGNGVRLGFLGCVLEGSRVAISGAISKVTIIIPHIRGLLTPLIATHQPSSKAEVVRNAALKWTGIVLRGGL